MTGALSSANDQDYFRFSMDAGQTVTLAGVGNGAATIALELRDGSGTLLATSVAGAGNAASLNNFLVSTAGNYFVRVICTSSAPYTLVVVHNAILESESNDTSATAQDITGAANVLGTIANGVIQTIDAFDSGFWTQNDTHNPNDKSYLTGLSGGVGTRAYFLFNLSPYPVTAAQLVLTNPPGGFVSPDATETLSLNATSQSITSLMGSSGIFVYNNLLFGSTLGSPVVSATSNGKDVTIPLGVFAPSTINGKKGSQFAIRRLA